MTYDTIIRNGRWFDGTGARSAVRNIGIRDAHIAAISTDDLDDRDCPRVVDATGKWVLPGMLDIHTHYDIGVLNGPSVGGRAVFLDGKPTDLVGRQRTGRFLRAADKAPAASEKEFASVS